MIARDIRLGLGSIWRTKLSSLSIILCVAIGIAAASAATTLVYSVLFRPKPRHRAAVPHSMHRGESSH